MNLKNKRVPSLIIVVVIYAFAITVGIVAYNFLPFDIWLSLLIADVVATIVTFAFSLILSNASVYDPYWSVQPAVIVVAFAIGKRFTIQSLLLIAVILLWAIRLTANWAYTFHSFKYQDWRYVMLKENTGALYPIVNFLGIHLFPTIVVYLCTMPAVTLILSNVSFNVLSIPALILSVGAVVLQGVSDCQMHKYRKNKTTNFIRIGLWHYSRHPNYLGEILMWWGVGLYVVAHLPSNWYLLLGAIVNTLMFLFISIPMADKRQSAKEGWEEYKKQTRMLLPIKKF